jgi:aminoglycoside phosphotransferase (APT) family kinase protein
MDPELRAILLRAFPECSVESCEELRGGISCRAVVARLVLADGARQQVVVRRPQYASPGETLRVVRCEHQILLLCAELGIAAPRPLHLDISASALVLAYIEGTPDFAPRDPEDMVRQLARQLALIHGMDPGTQLQLQHRNVSARRNIEHVPERLDESLDEGRIRARLARLWPWPQYNPDCVLHGDYWPGNTLWQDGKLVAAIDWEEAELGDPLADIAITRLDLLWAFGPEVMQLFTSCYRAQTHLDWRNLPCWDLCVALRPMSNLARWVESFVAPPISRPDVTEAHMRKAHRAFVMQALQRLDGAAG